MKKIVLLISAVVMMTACGTKPASEQESERQNPFLVEWTTPYGVPPFDQIQDSDYLPAFTEGLKERADEIEAIKNNPDAPTFENTVEALDNAGFLLNRVGNVFFNLMQTDVTPEMKKVQSIILPLASEASSKIYMDSVLFARIDQVYQQKDDLKLDGEQQRVLELIHLHFVNNGVGLSADKKEELQKVNSELSVLTEKFGTNVLEETNSFQLVLSTPEELAGLPQNVLDFAAASAKAAGKAEGEYVFGLQKPSWIPFLTYSSNRALRQKMFEAYAMRGNNGNDYDNKGTLKQIMKLRIRQAHIMGYETPAAYILSDKMAQNPETVDAFLQKIMTAASVKAKQEVKEMQAIVDQEGGNFEIKPWDWFYYSNKVKESKYALNENELLPYFEANNVRQGAFECAHKLYGLNFEKMSDLPVYNPEVEAFKVTDADGSLIGIFYTDYYLRSTKQGGAWMTNFVTQYYKNGQEQRPAIVNVGNFTNPTEDTPCLLSLDDVETVFHEFGHALHGLLTQCHYNTTSGTNVAQDFVELPSQINENWAFQPEVLRMYAKNYKTGEVISDELIEKIQKTGTFNQGFATSELCAAAMLDMKWHELSDVKQVDELDVMDFETSTMKEIGLIDEIIPRYRSTYFSHIFAGGYFAGYYGYLWAEVLDKDGFAYFMENGIFDQATAKKFRHILESGASEEPMKLYKEFRGQDPSIEPLLEGRGLVDPK